MKTLLTLSALAVAASIALGGCDETEPIADSGEPTVVTAESTVPGKAGEGTDARGGAEHQADRAWMTNLDEAMKLAKSENKMVMVDFMATWCGPCQMYVDKVFPTEQFKEAAKDFILVKIDTDEQPKVAQKYGVSGIPDIRFLAPDGSQVSKVVGYKGERLLDDMRSAKSAAGL